MKIKWKTVNEIARIFIGCGTGGGLTSLPFLRTDYIMIPWFSLCLAMLIVGGGWFAAFSEKHIKKELKKSLQFEQCKQCPFVNSLIRDWGNLYDEKWSEDYRSKGSPSKSLSEDNPQEV